MILAKFDHFGEAHLITLAITLTLIVLLCVAGWRTRSAGRKLRVAECSLAALMCLTFPWQVFLAIHYGYEGLDPYLPLHLCDVTAYLGAIALVTRWRLPSELVYFWGIGATVQALVTPAGLYENFPHPTFFVFFVHHGCIVIAALYVVVGRRDYPRPGAVWRAMLWSQVYFAVAGIANMLSGTNYAFLCSKPTGTGSLLDLMGPWPWYLVGLEIAALITFSLLYLPFHFRNLRVGRRRRING